MASNNWVIHGNHTASGLPILETDPHLSTGIPSTWIL
jgi:penicillin amidase